MKKDTPAKVKETYDDLRLTSCKSGYVVMMIRHPHDMVDFTSNAWAFSAKKDALAFMRKKINGSDS